MLAGVVAALSILLYAVLHFPASFANGGSTPFLLTAAGLILYGLVAMWSRKQSFTPFGTSFRVGTAIGLAIAILAVVNHVIELWTPLSPSAGGIMGSGMWGLMFLAFGIACSTALLRDRSIRVGLLASAWSAMVMAIVVVVFAWSIGFLFMPHMQQVLSAPYAASGMTDADAFVTRHLVSSAASHLFLAPAIALFVGGLSAVAFSILTPVTRRTALLLAGAGLVLLSAGAISIGHATSLLRDERPPFIQFGLAAFAVSIVSAHPLLVAIRRSRQ